MKYCTSIAFDLSGLMYNPSKRKEPKTDRYFIDVILEVVCNYYGIRQYQLKSASRKRSYSDARSIAIYLLKKYTRMTLKQIGELFSKRDHTTIIFNINKFNDLHDTNAAFLKDYQRIIKVLDRQFKKDTQPNIN